MTTIVKWVASGSGWREVQDGVWQSKTSGNCNLRLSPASGDFSTDDWPSSGFRLRCTITNRGEGTVYVKAGNLDAQGFKQLTPVDSCGPRQEKKIDADPKLVQAPAPGKTNRLQVGIFTFGGKGADLDVTGVELYSSDSIIITPDTAPAESKGGQYVTVPGFSSPGNDTTPLRSHRAPESTVVFSARGWQWTETTNEYQSAVSEMVRSTIETAVKEMKTLFGEVYYIQGDENTKPTFAGASAGDTCRVQDPFTKDIVAEWKWTGSEWQRARVSSAQISNLDVGKLTAGSASINELVARKIAAASGTFMDIKTEQLTVSGEANIKKAVVTELWNKMMHVEHGEFAELDAGLIKANTITADKVQAGFFNGQLIVGSTIRTSMSSQRVELNPTGMYMYDRQNHQTARFTTQGDIFMRGNLGRRDSWSQAYFADITTRNGTDVDSAGNKWGVGLWFDSTQTPYRTPATIVMRENRVENYMPELLIQAPQWTDYKGTPRITLSQNGFWTDDGGDGRYTHIASYQGKLDFSTKNAFWVANNSDSARNDRNNYSYNIIYSDQHAANFHMAGWGGSRSGLFINETGTWISSPNGRNQVIAENGTVRFSGSVKKAFTMWVPGMLGKNLQLQHFSTESPYSGIEYWQNVKLDESGHGTWDLPPYVGNIADDTTPWIALAGNGASAELKQDGFMEKAGRWSVELTGKPDTSVPVLVKGARVVEDDYEMMDDGVTPDLSRPIRWSKAETTPVWVLPIIPNPGTLEERGGPDMVTLADGAGPCTEQEARDVYHWSPEEAKVD